MSKFCTTRLKIAPSGWGISSVDFLILKSACGSCPGQLPGSVVEKQKSTQEKKFGQTDTDTHTHGGGAPRRHRTSSCQNPNCVACTDASGGQIPVPTCSICDAFAHRQQSNQRYSPASLGGRRSHAEQPSLPVIPGARVACDSKIFDTRYTETKSPKNYA